MSYLFKDKNGDNCAAKTIFVIGSLSLILKAFFSGFTYGDFAVQEVDYTGMAALIGALGAVYFGRNHTKETKK